MKRSDVNAQMQNEEFLSGFQVESNLMYVSMTIISQRSL